MRGAGKDAFLSSKERLSGPRGQESGRAAATHQKKSREQKLARLSGLGLSSRAGSASMAGAPERKTLGLELLLLLLPPRAALRRGKKRLLRRRAASGKPDTRRPAGRQCSPAVAAGASRGGHGRALRTRRARLCLRLAGRRLPGAAAQRARGDSLPRAAAAVPCKALSSSAKAAAACKRMNPLSVRPAGRREETGQEPRSSCASLSAGGRFAPYTERSVSCAASKCARGAATGVRLRGCAACKATCRRCRRLGLGKSRAYRPQ